MRGEVSGVRPKEYKVFEIKATLPLGKLNTFPTVVAFITCFLSDFLRVHYYLLLIRSNP